VNPTPKISVVMSAYNAAAYLREAIESILAQTFRDFEFIIINDGSRDDTGQIILSFTDPRIVYIKNESNLGLIASLNKGLQAATGKYIARMDADDISLPVRFQKQIDLLESNNEVVVCGSDYFLLSRKNLHLVKNKNDSDYQKSMLLFAPCFCHPAVMMRNIFSKQNLFYKKEYKHVEDYKLWTDLISYGEFANVNEPLLKYRSHPGQVSTENQLIQTEASKRIREEYYRNLGLKLSAKESEALNIIGNNVFISSEETLKEIEKALRELIKQNHSLELFSPASFNKLIHKAWLDSCGNTSLGLKAFSIGVSSDLFHLVPASPKEKMKLFVKCVIRKFK
jgi:glycosyltransferase involved in cell wall biosynthesis